MATKLKDLVITKVAIVDEGSCSAAHIKLFKKKEGGSEVMKFEEILAKMKPEEAAVIKASMEEEAVAAKEAAKEDAKKEAAKDMAGKDKEVSDLKEELTKAKDELAAVELAKSKATADQTEEDIIKSLDPAVQAIIKKSKAQADAAQAAIKKMKDDQDDVEAINKAKELPNLGTAEAELKDVIKSLNGVDADLANKVLGIFKTANEAINTGDLFGEVGSNAQLTKGKDVWTTIDAKAAAIAKVKNISQEAAISEVFEQEPDLYAQYVQAVR